MPKLWKKEDLVGTEFVCWLLDRPGERTGNLKNRYKYLCVSNVFCTAYLVQWIIPTPIKSEGMRFEPLSRQLFLSLFFSFYFQFTFFLKDIPSVIGVRRK